MTIDEFLDLLIEADGPICIADLLDEASVHLPRRGSIWIASYRDDDGVQRWRSTGLRDREAAQAMADYWEAQAARKRAAKAPGPKKPTIRVRLAGPEHSLGLLSQKEVAVLMKISERSVREIERRAFWKIRNHPLMKRFWAEWQGREIDESKIGADWRLSQAEIAAIHNLAMTPEERRVLRKVIAMIHS